MTERPLSLVPCAFCYEGRDTRPVPLHDGKVKYLCVRCLRELAKQAVNPQDVIAARLALGYDIQEMGS